MRKKVFITGEAGHLGSLIRKSFSEKGHQIVNDYYLDYAKHKKQHLPNTFTHNYNLELDIKNTKLIRKVISETRPDIIIHTAAYVGSDKCDADKIGAYEVNVMRTSKICMLIEEYCPSSLFVNFSTTATCDPSEYSLKKPITEITKRNPQTWYGKTKLLGEEVIKKQTRKWINFLPVFLFSKFPNDTSSIWPKLFFNSLNRKSFDILLNKKIYKQYEYSENIIRILYKIIFNDKALHHDIIITGNEVRKFGDFLNIAETEFKKITGKKLLYKLHPEDDYLKHHVADNSTMLRLAGITESKYNKQRKDFHTAIIEVIKSCF